MPSEPQGSVIPRALQGATLGLLAGSAVGLTPQMEMGPVFWAPVLTLVGGLQGWIGWWILKQSGDVPKMRAAVPLTGPVMASVACVFTGEGFTLPVLATLLVGTVMGWILGAGRKA